MGYKVLRSITIDSVDCVGYSECFTCLVLCQPHKHLSGGYSYLLFTDEETGTGERSQGSLHLPKVL